MLGRFTRIPGAHALRSSRRQLAAPPGPNLLDGKPRIVYTLTDEAPALATYSLYPVLKKFAAKAGIDVVISDISLASRILAQFPKYLKEDQYQVDTLAELGELCTKKEANIIKVSAIFLILDFSLPGATSRSVPLPLCPTSLP